MEFVKVRHLVVLCLIVLVSFCEARGSEFPGDDYDPSTVTIPARRKRTLVYPLPSTLLLIFGLGTPLQLDRESVIVGAFAKFIYTLPTNSSEYTEPGVHYSRDSVSKSRWSLYRTLARLAELYGFGDGRLCVLRAICEVASAPFDHRHGLLQHLLQIFLSPSSTVEKYEEYQDREYQAAERLGKHVGENCHALYPECRRSFLDVFSSVRNSLLLA